MLKLTKLNYFTNKNNYISNSKLSDYKKSPRYFYELHVLGTRTKEESDALIIGKAVDCWLTGGGRAEFEKRYIKVARRSKDPQGLMIELTSSAYDDVVAMCEAVEQTAAYKELKGFKTQQILQWDKPIGKLFAGICGIPDWIKIDKKNMSCEITDLKTARTISRDRYYYHAVEFSYFRQQALYQMLVEYNTGIKEFVSKHLVVEKDSDKIFNTATFILDQNIIEDEKTEIKRLLAEIAIRDDFTNDIVSFKTAILLTNPSPAKPELDGWENA